MDSDTLEMVRSPYTIWDYFADLGGLNDFIRIAGSMVMGIYTVLTGSGLEKFLISNLFFVEGTSLSGQSGRKPAKF